MVKVFHIILNYVSKLFLTGYVIDLIKRTIEMCEKGESIEELSEIPKPLSSQYERPEKSMAIKMHKSRFTLQ